MIIIHVIKYFGNPLYFLVAVIVFITALVLGIRKGKSNGYRIFSLFWLTLGIHLALLMLAYADTMLSQGMGKPELMGSIMLSIMTVSSFGFFMTIILNLCLLGFRFNPRDLLPEISSILICGLLIFGTYRISSASAEWARQIDTQESVDPS